MTVYYRGFFRCACGKMHSYGGMGFGSVCTCGVNLNAHVFHRGPSVVGKFEPRPDIIELAKKIAAQLASSKASE